MKVNNSSEDDHPEVPSEPETFITDEEKPVGNQLEKGVDHWSLSNFGEHSWFDQSVDFAKLMTELDSRGLYNDLDLMYEIDFYAL